MNPVLAKAFVERGVIRQGTVLEAYQSAKGLSCVCDAYTEGRYVVLSASSSDGWVYFRVASSATEQHKIRCDYVTAIDGMAIERVAAAHHLRLDGQSAGYGVRRGRKRLTESDATPIGPAEQYQQHQLKYGNVGLHDDERGVVGQQPDTAEHR
jgi:hypothetical protein